MIAMMLAVGVLVGAVGMIVRRGFRDAAVQRDAIHRELREINSRLQR